MLYSNFSDWKDTGHIFPFTAGVLRRPCEVAAVLCLPRRTAGKRWHKGLRAETGAQADTGGGFHLHIHFSVYICIVKEFRSDKYRSFTLHHKMNSVDVFPRICWQNWAQKEISMAGLVGKKRTSRGKHKHSECCIETHENPKHGIHW